MHNALSIVEIAVDVFLTVVFVGLLLYLANVGVSVNSLSKNGVSYFLDKSSEMDWADFEGEIVNGDTVRYLIDNYCKPDENGESISAMVSTKHFVKTQKKNGYNRYLFNGEEYSKVGTDSKYLDPSSSFVMNIIYREDSSATHIQFLEVGVETVNAKNLTSQEKVRDKLKKELELMEHLVNEYEQGIGSYQGNNVPDSELKLAYERYMRAIYWNNAYNKVVTELGSCGF